MKLSLGKKSIWGGLESKYFKQCHVDDDVLNEVSKTFNEKKKRRKFRNNRFEFSFSGIES